MKYHWHRLMAYLEGVQFSKVKPRRLRPKGVRGWQGPPPLWEVITERLGNDPAFARQAIKEHIERHLLAAKKSGKSVTRASLRKKIREIEQAQQDLAALINAGLPPTELYKESLLGHFLPRSSLEEMGAGFRMALHRRSQVLGYAFNPFESGRRAAQAKQHEVLLHDITNFDKRTLRTGREAAERAIRVPLRRQQDRELKTVLARSNQPMWPETRRGYGDIVQERVRAGFDAALAKGDETAKRVRSEMLP